MTDEEAAEIVERVINHAEPALRDQELEDLCAVVDHLRGESNA